MHFSTILMAAFAGLTLARNVDISYASLQDPGSNCIDVSSYRNELAQALTAQLKSDSDNGDCSAHKGSDRDVKWKLYETSSGCDTTAELGTIQGALDVYVKKVGNSVCGVSCLQLSHGGTWNAYAVFASGHGGYVTDNYTCNQNTAFSGSVSGGEGDVN